MKTLIKKITFVFNWNKTLVKEKERKAEIFNNKKILDTMLKRCTQYSLKKNI